MPGSDFTLLPPPSPSTLHCQPLRQTQARCKTRVHAIHAAPSPSRFLPASGREARVGRFPARNLRLSSLYSRLVRGCVARSRGRQSTARSGSLDSYTHPPEGLTPETRSAAGGGRKGETWARVEVGGRLRLGVGAPATRPPYAPLLPSSPPPPCTVNGKMEMDVEGVSPRPEPIPRSQGAGGACQAPPQPPQPQPQQQQLAQDELPGESAGAEDSDDPEARPNSEKGENKYFSDKIH
ncbi:uncharacterized protein V5649_021294 isoform 1-T1 [Rhynchonycteris naso]